MKRFFEKNPLIHYTTVLTLVAIVCGLMIGGVNAVTAPIIEDNIIRAKVEAYERVLPSIVTYEELPLLENDPSTIQSKVLAKDGSGANIGYIYEVFGTNKFGFMRIVVSVNNSGVILGADFVEINQTYQVEGTRSNLQSYVGSSVSELAPVGDIISGATGSLNTLKALLTDVALSHSITATGPDDPLVAWFGVGYQMEEDTTFVPTDKVLSKMTVRDADNQIIGAYYHLRGNGVKSTEEGSIGAINLYIGLSQDGTILGIDLPKDEYGHTTNNAYYPKVVNYAQSLVGDNIASFDGQDDLAAGATNSKTLVDTLLTALGGILE